MTAPVAPQPEEWTAAQAEAHTLLMICKPYADGEIGMFLRDHVATALIAAARRGRESVEAERDRLRRAFGVVDEGMRNAISAHALSEAKSETAQARIAAMEAALREIAHYDLDNYNAGGEPTTMMPKIARAALAASEVKP